MGEGWRSFSGMKGSAALKVGKDSSVFLYTDIALALAAADSGDVIDIYPGTYSLSAELLIDKSITLRGIGRVIIDGGSAGIVDRLIMIDKPSAGTIATNVYIDNIRFENAYAAADVFIVWAIA